MAFPACSACLSDVDQIRRRQRLGDGCSGGRTGSACCGGEVGYDRTTDAGGGSVGISVAWWAVAGAGGKDEDRAAG